MTQPLETLTTGQQTSIRGYLGITEGDATTFPVSRYWIAADGANMRPAYQAAITAAAAVNGRVINDYGAVTQQVWEKAYDTPAVFDTPTINRNRTLTIPACSNIEIDFAGANIVLKGPTGGDRFATGGQTVPGIATAGFGFATWNGKWLPGFLVVLGVIKRLKIANVDVEGGFTGDSVDQANANLFDKGFQVLDLGDISFGAGQGFGDLVMENVVLHGFAGELMYDNSSRNHFSRDCHFYNSGHSCWNPSGLGRLVATNLQAGIARQPAEVLGGKGHTYIGGRFYKAGGAGSTFIGGPDPTFDGIAYNTPVRRTDAPPPYMTFVNTRFEDYPTGFLYLGSYTRGSIITTDVALFLATGFASGSELKDIDLDVYATCDRKGSYNAVTLGGQATNNGTQPKNINLRIHCARTKLATGTPLTMSALEVSGFIDATNCAVTIDGTAEVGFAATYVAGSVLPLIDMSGFSEQSLNYFGFGADQTYTIARRAVTLSPSAAGTFNFILNTAPGYTDGQLFTFRHDGSGAADRIISFAMNGAGMKLNATRTIRRGGEYLTVRRSVFGAAWVEHAYMGQGV